MLDGIRKWFRDGWQEIRAFGSKPENDPEAQVKALEQTALVLARAIGTHGSPEAKRRALMGVTEVYLEGLVELSRERRVDPVP